MTDSPSTSPETEAETASSREAPARLVSGPVAVSGRLSPPPSKSYSHRYLTLALLAGKPLVIEGLLEAEDTRLYLKALRQCGFEIEQRGRETVLRPPLERPPGGTIDCGNAGTMFRFLTAVLCVVPGLWRLDGTPRLRERTVGPLIRSLRGLGADISCSNRDGYAPFEIRGGSLQAGETRLDAGQSSQFLSAMLLAGQGAPGPLSVFVDSLTSAPYLDLTLDAIRRFGGRVEPSVAMGRGGEASAGRSFRAFPSDLGMERVEVEGDYSAACYPAAAAALTGGEVRLDGMRRDSLQGDRGFFDTLERMGAEVKWEQRYVTIHGAGLDAVTEDFSAMPDQVPTLAALAPFARGTTRIRNVAHLRIKESDRLHAMAAGLRRLGVPVDEREDSLAIEGVWSEGVPAAPEVEIETYDDHRIAMSFALVGLRRGGVRILDPAVVGKSYPYFWRDLEALIVS